LSGIEGLACSHDVGIDAHTYKRDTPNKGKNRSRYQAGTYECRTSCDEATTNRDRL
jgi:hypothetical protein